jgi:ketol-acid reductoisomerase
VAVIGYGNLGRPFAFNLRESGVPLVVGATRDQSKRQAIEDGFQVLDIDDAARQADVLILLLPDEVMPDLYMRDIFPSLKPGDLLVFASGYTIAFGYLEPPLFVDTVLLAPRTIGDGVREGYLSGSGYLSFLSVHHDATGRAKSLLLALAQAVGALRLGALEMTFRQEAELDLFIQQAFLPALQNLMINAAEVLVTSGYPPEAALLDLYMSGEIGYALSKAAGQGLLDTIRMYSLTAQYGMLSRAERFTDPRQRRQMELTLQEIQEGRFAEEWADEYMAGYPKLDILRRRREKLPLWVLEQQVIESLRKINQKDQP